MVHVGRCPHSKGASAWSCGLEHEVEGVDRGRFDGAGSARVGWPGGKVLLVTTVPSVVAARRVMHLAAARLPSACSAKLSSNMQKWEKDKRRQAEWQSEGPRVGSPGSVCNDSIGSPGSVCNDSIGYHGSYQMTSSLRESCGIWRGGIPRSAVLALRGKHAHTAGEEMARLVNEAAQEERAASR